MSIYGLGNTILGVGEKVVYGTGGALYSGGIAVACKAAGTYANWISPDLDNNQIKIIAESTKKFFIPLHDALNRISANCSRASVSSLIEKTVVVRIAAVFGLALNKDNFKPLDPEDKQAIEFITDNFIGNTLLPTLCDRKTVETLFAAFDNPFLDDIGVDAVVQAINNFLKPEGKPSEIVLLIREALIIQIANCLGIIAGKEENGTFKADRDKGFIGRAISKLVSSESIHFKNRAGLLKTCAQYQNWQILLAKLGAYKRALKIHLKQQIKLDPNNLQPNALKHLESEFLKASFNEDEALQKALRAYCSPSIPDEGLVVYFFSRPIQKVLNANNATVDQVIEGIDNEFESAFKKLKSKQKDDLFDSFNPVFETVLKQLRFDETRFFNSVFMTIWNTVQLTNFEWLKRKFKIPDPKEVFSSVKDAILDQIVDRYRESMVAPEKLPGLLEELKPELFLGQPNRYENECPEDAEAIVSSLEWQNRLFKKSGIDKLTEFLNAALSVGVSQITHKIRTYCAELKPKVDGTPLKPQEYLMNQMATIDKDVFDFVGEHIKAKLLRVLINITDKFVDDLGDIPEGNHAIKLHGNDELLGRLFINLSKIWRAKRDRMGARIATWNTMPEGTPEEKEAKAIYFRSIFSDLIKDLLDVPNIDLLEDVPFLSKNEELNKKIREEYLPEFLGTLIVGFMRWELNRESNEKNLLDFSPYTLEALKVFARMGTEGAQNQIALNAKEFATKAQEQVVQQLKDLKAESDKEVVDAIDNTLLQALDPSIAKGVDHIQNVVEASLPGIVDETSLWENVEDAVYPAIVQLFTNFLELIKKIKSADFISDTFSKSLALFDAHMKKVNQAKDANKDIFDGVAELSTTGVLANKDYVAAKKRYNKAKQEVDAAQTAISNLSWSDEGKEAKADLEAAKKELKEATDELNVCKEKLCAPYAVKVLNLVKLLGFEDLPSNVDELNKILWDKLTTLVIPKLLATIHRNLSDKHTINNIILSGVEKMVNTLSLASEAKTDAEIQVILIELEADSQKTKKTRDLAKQALAGIKAGQTVLKVLTALLSNENINEDTKEFYSLKFAAEAQIDKEIRRHLKLAAANEHKVPRTAGFANKALAAITKGQTSTKAIIDLLISDAIDEDTKAEFKNFMVTPLEKDYILHQTKTYHWQQETVEHWNKLVDSKLLEEYKLSQKAAREFQATLGENVFDAKLGSLIKGFFDLFSGTAKYLVNYPTIQKIASETIGASVRGQLEQLKLLELIKQGLEIGAKSVLKDAKWDNKADGSKVLVKPVKIHGQELSRDFELPLTAKAKEVWEVKQLEERERVAKAEKNTLVQAMGLQVRQGVNNAMGSFWNHLLDKLLILIDMCVSENAVAIKNSFKKVISEIERAVASVVDMLISSVTFIIRKILEMTWFPSKVDEFNECIQMEIHEEVIWDVMFLVIDQLHKYAEAGPQPKIA
jgi:hypothetical protein